MAWHNGVAFPVLFVGLGGGGKGGFTFLSLQSPLTFAELSLYCHQAGKVPFPSAPAILTPAPQMPTPRERVFLRKKKITVDTSHVAGGKMCQKMKEVNQPLLDL